MLELTWRTRKKKKGPPSRTAYISGTYEGHRIRESLGASSREEGQRKFERRRREIIDAIDAGRDPDLRFASAVSEYMKAEDKDDRFLEPLICELGEERICDLNTPRVHEAAAKLYPKAKPSTRNRQVIAPLMAVVNYCAEKKLCPPIRIKRLKEGKASKRAVTREWVDKFCVAARALAHPNLADMELMMFTTAARLGDCQKLEWPDVHLETKTATFRCTKNEDDRDAILTPELARSLATRRPQDGQGLVFGIMTRGRRGSLYPRWRRICEAAGIDYVPPHQAGRHSFATEMMVRNKVDVKTTMKLGGWRSSSVLVDRYSHPEGERQVVEAIFGMTKAPGPSPAAGADTRIDTSVIPIRKSAG